MVLPLIARSMSNGPSIRLTALSAMGEMITIF
jgi:hypothetical protein